MLNPRLPPRKSWPHRWVDLLLIVRAPVVVGGVPGAATWTRGRLGRAKGSHPAPTTRQRVGSFFSPALVVVGGVPWGRDMDAGSTGEGEGVPTDPYHQTTGRILLLPDTEGEISRERAREGATTRLTSGRNPARPWTTDCESPTTILSRPYPFVVQGQ